MPETISCQSEYFELAPSDVILSGTPARGGPVGKGDVMAVSIEGPGRLRIPVV